MDRAEFGLYRIWISKYLDFAEFGLRGIWITQNLACLTYPNLKSQRGPWIKLAELKSDDKGRLSNMYDVWVRSIWIRRQRIPLLALLRLGSSGWNSFFCFFTVDLKIKVMRVGSNIFCDPLIQMIYEISHLPWLWASSDAWHRSVGKNMISWMKGLQIVASDPRYHWIQESIKPIFNSGLFLAVRAAERKKLPTLFGVVFSTFCEQNKFLKNFKKYFCVRIEKLHNIKLIKV